MSVAQRNKMSPISGGKPTRLFVGWVDCVAQRNKMTPVVLQRATLVCNVQHDVLRNSLPGMKLRGFSRARRVIEKSYIYKNLRVINNRSAVEALRASISSLSNLSFQGVMQPPEKQANSGITTEPLIAETGRYAPPPGLLTDGSRTIILAGDAASWTSQDSRMGSGLTHGQ